MNSYQERNIASINTDLRWTNNSVMVTLAIDEIKEWFNNNTISDFKLISLIGNKIIIMMTYNKQNHIIQIEYPKNYPLNKTGYVITEISPNEIKKFKFIQDANKQCDKKILSIK